MRVLSIKKPLQLKAGHEDPPPRSILLLCYNNRDNANTILDHIESFLHFSRNNVRVYNPVWVKRSFSLDLNEFDVVVLHYSLYILSDRYLSSDFKEKLRRFRGLKIQFIQDDYRQIDEFAAAMRDLGVHILFTLYPQAQIPKVWDEQRLPDVIKITTLAGYIPERLVSRVASPAESRPIDIGYRGRAVPYWLGQFGQEKIRIGQGVLERAERFGLKCDIAWREEDRIYGEDWNRFISSCKAVLGTESGASITDFDGSVERKVKQYLTKNPTTSFEDVHREILKPYEDNVPIKVISPRMFEAIALRTALILFPGEYSLILRPWIHYIPLQRDFSNLDDVVEKLKDEDFLGALTERAYADIVASGRYSFRCFIKEFDEVVTKYAPPHRKSLKWRYWFAGLERPLGLSLFRVRDRLIRLPNLLYAGSLESFVALRLIFQTPSLRKIFLRYLWNIQKWKGVRLRTFMKELFLLGIIERVQAGTLPVKMPFSVVVDFIPQEGILTMTSRPSQKIEEYPANSISRINDRSDQALWPSIYSALENGRIKRMVWDHSPVNGYFLYKQMPSLWLNIVVGVNGVRTFSSVVAVTASAS